MDLAAKDSYIQKLASKIISQREEPTKMTFVHFRGKSDTDPPSKKKKKPKKKNVRETGTDKTPKPQQSRYPSPAAPKSPGKTKSTTQSVNGGTLHTPKEKSFSTVDVLRKRLHEKIEESRGQGAPQDALSEAVKEKRTKRKKERERKKRKRKEFLLKKLAEQSGQEQPAEIKEEPIASVPIAEKRVTSAIVFNKVETVDEGYETKFQAKMKKKKSEKGKITPLTGRNYKQLLSRVEARKEKLERLREKDEAKASELENKIKWTNMLYKAEGIKIKDDEDQLRASLKRKEKRREQRKKKWTNRSENVIEKMQQRQDKRRKNLQKQKQAKIEKKKNRARKKGRVLPEDLKKAAV